MGIVRGISAIREEQAPKVGVPYLSLKDGDQVVIRFLQEFDESSEFYNTEAGLGVYAVEWRDPENFRQRCLDTSESEGKCWPLEQRYAQLNDGMERTDPKIWKSRRSIYINVLVGEGDKAEVKLLNQGFGPKSISNWLLDYVEETGSITNVKFKLKRKGAGQFDTEYSLTPVGFYDEPVSVDGLELIDIENVALNHVPYDEQEKYFRPNGTQDESSGEMTEEEESVWK